MFSQPPVHRRMVDFQAFCLLRPILFIQRCFRMDIQIIHGKDYFFMPWVTFIRQAADFLCPVVYCPLFPGSYVSPSCQWFRKHKDAACPFLDVLRIRLLRIARPYRERFSCFSKKLVRFFIHAYDGAAGVIRHFVNIQDILYACCKCGVFF